MRLGPPATFLVVVLLMAGCSAHAAASGAGDQEKIPPFPAEDRFVQCLRDRGWDAHRGLTSPPSIAGTPKEQASSLEDDEAACGDSSGYTKAGTPAQWTEEQKKELYQREVANHACIVAHGQPSDDPPSQEVFLETFGSDQGWYQAIAAYQNSGNINLREYGKLLVECPPPLMFNTIPGF
jgi:hypothetical protein